MIYIEEALEKFKNLAPEVVLTIDSDIVAKQITALENKYQISLSPLVIYWAIGEVRIDQIKDYLKKELVVDARLIEEIEMSIREKIIKPINSRLIFLDARPAKTNISMSQEKAIILEIFKTKLKEELNNHPVIINAINSRIFAVLSEDQDFFETMEKALYANFERLTPHNINLSGKLTEPTVANWLNDFIINNSSDYFTTVTLSQYITTSVNIRNLSDQEKETVTRLILLYRNVKFFDEVFDEVPPEKWEILPLRINKKISDISSNEEVSAGENKIEMTALELKALQETEMSLRHRI